ncbi:MAG: Eco57I restriction-modification methylase domain-containing protein [bacterium]
MLRGTDRGVFIDFTGAPAGQQPPSVFALTEVGDISNRQVPVTELPAFLERLRVQVDAIDPPPASASPEWRSLPADTRLYISAPTAELLDDDGDVDVGPGITGYPRSRFVAAADRDHALAQHAAVVEAIGGKSFAVAMLRFTGRETLRVRATALPGVVELGYTSPAEPDVRPMHMNPSQLAVWLERWKCWVTLETWAANRPGVSAPSPDALAINVTLDDLDAKQFAALSKARDYFIFGEGEKYTKAFLGQGLGPGYRIEVAAQGEGRVVYRTAYGTHLWWAPKGASPREITRAYVAQIIIPAEAEHLAELVRGGGWEDLEHATPTLATALTSVFGECCIGPRVPEAEPKPAKPSTSTKPAKPSTSTKPAKPSTSTKPKPAKPSTSTKPAKPSTSTLFDRVGGSTYHQPGRGPHVTLYGPIGRRAEPDPAPALSTVPAQRHGAPAEPTRASVRSQRNHAALAVVDAATGHLTEEQRATVRGYSGWGGLTLQGEWTHKTDKPDQQALVHEYYTPAGVAYDVVGVVDALLRRGAMLRTTGMAGAPTVLEPSAGVGRFIDAGRPDYQWTACEYSPASASLLRALHPDVELHVGPFETYATRAAADGVLFDAVIGNPPYGPRGAVITLDPDRDVREKAAYRYFLLRSLTLLRPRGICAMVIPVGFLTGSDPAFRTKVHDLAELVAAFALPVDLFPGARVGVAAVFFRRRAVLPETLAPWVEGPFFDDHPDMVLGEWKRGGRYQDLEVTGSYEGLPAFTPLVSLDDPAPPAAPATGAAFVPADGGDPLALPSSRGSLSAMVRAAAAQGVPGTIQVPDSMRPEVAALVDALAVLTGPPRGALEPGG